MKKSSLFTVIFAAAALLVAMQSQSKDFKGVISYNITFSGSDIPAEMQSFLPKALKTSIGEGFVKTEMFGGSFKTISIKNLSDKSVYNLIDLMGTKTGYKSTFEEIQQDMSESSDFKVELANETKEILGYKCKKAIITGNKEGEEISITVYYTEELGNSDINFDDPEFKDIKGVMLEFEIPTPQFTMTLTATSVEKKSVPAEEFKVPEEYKIITKQEFESQFGGM